MKDIVVISWDSYFISFVCGRVLIFFIADCAVVICHLLGQGVGIYSCSLLQNAIWFFLCSCFLFPSFLI